MAKYKRLGYALSAAAMVAGSGVLAPATWADGEICTAELEAESCVASNLDQLELGLGNANINTITTSGAITVSGEDVDKTLQISKEINGAAGANVFHVEDGAKLTLRGSGTINAGRYGVVADGAELVIDGPTINAVNNACYGVYAKDNGRVTMESGMVVADYAAFAGNNTTGDMNFYINGGLLKSNRYPAIYMPGQVDLVMRGGTLDGGIVARMGQIRIEGGTINKQATPVEGDGIDVNYGGMPSVANEAITLIGGSYKSTTTEYGNDMNVTIGDGNIQINGDVVLYDLGNTAEGYEQNINVRITGGRLTGVKTKFTEEEIGFALREGYTAGANNAAGRVRVEISGGEYTAEPDEEELAPGYEAELNGETGVYEIWPTQVDWGDWWIEDGGAAEGHLSGAVEFGQELIADRKATLSMVEVGTEELTLDEEAGGDILGAVDINMLDRSGQAIVVQNNELTVYIDLDEETHTVLAAYDKLYAVYFDEDGAETERFEVTLSDPEMGYWLEFQTTHLSTYGVVGVNEEAEEAAATPETGTVTAAGASAMVASVMTAVIVGIMTSVVSFMYLIRRKQ